MKKVIRLLNAGDAPAYEKLLVESFGSAEGFAVNSAALRWGSTENQYSPFGVFHDNVLVSMLRTESVLSERELLFKLNDSFTHSELQFPAMYLAKAATLPAVKGHGLNSVLRYLSLQLALEWKARFVFGAMVEGSPRVFTMTEMGYEFQKLPKKWNGSFVSQKTTLLGVLDMQKKGEQALSYLESKTKVYLSDTDLQVDLKAIPLMKATKIRWPWSA